MQVAVYDGKFYAKEILYQSGLTNTALIEKLKTLFSQIGEVEVIKDYSEIDRIIKVKLN